jgi:RimJ/RimL family protein N-acetyltransferase
MALERDPEVMRFLTGDRLVTEAEGRLDDTFLQPRGTEPHVWTARRATTGSFVGWFCLWPEEETVAELGYRLCRAEWGKGLASEGASALVNWGFDSAGYAMITASTMAANRASRRVLEKCGFGHVGTVQVDWAEDIPGGEQGEVRYALARSGWARGPRGP